MSTFETNCARNQRSLTADMFRKLYGLIRIMGTRKGLLDLISLKKIRNISKFHFLVSSMLCN
jgi:hypothetical protein